MKHFLLAVVLLFSAQVARSGPLGAVVTTEFDPASKVTTLHIVNISQKEIVAVNLMLAIPMPDGTISTNTTQTTLDWLLNAEKVEGILPGGHYDFDLAPRDEGKVDATVDVVIYADDTAEIQNRAAFQRILDTRKGQAVAKQKINDLITDALANAPEGQRAAVVLDQLKALQKSVQDAQRNGRSANGAGLADAIQDMTNTSRGVQRTGNADQEARSLHYLIDRNTRQIELLTTHLEVKEVRR